MARKPKAETDAEWWARMARDYPHVDLHQQYTLASQWAADHRRTASRRFLINWLKRAEADATPVSPPPRPDAAPAQVNSTVAELMELAARGRRERARRKAAVG